MNGDGMNDIITSANLGTFVFQNLREALIAAGTSGFNEAALVKPTRRVAAGRLRPRR